LHSEPRRKKKKKKKRPGGVKMGQKGVREKTKRFALLTEGKKKGEGKLLCSAVPRRGSGAGGGRKRGKNFVPHWGGKKGGGEQAFAANNTGISWGGGERKRGGGESFQRFVCETGEFPFAWWGKKEKEKERERGEGKRNFPC